MTITFKIMANPEEIQKITLVDENGDETLYEILFTFHSEEYSKDYILLVPEGVEDGTNLSNPNFLGIPTTSENAEEAYKFIQFACTHDGAKILADQGVLPAYSDDEVAAAYNEFAAQEDDTLQRIISSPNNKLTDLCFPEYAEVQAAYEESMESYLVGNMSLDDALAD